MANDPKLGVSGTMSMEPPSPKDLKLDDALLQELKSRNEFEAPEETQRRCVVAAAGMRMTMYEHVVNQIALDIPSWTDWKAS